MHGFRILGTTLLLSLVLVAQSFSYSNFASTAGLTLVNHATTAAGVLVVTPALISQRGAVWNDLPVPVASGFETSFRFRCAQPSGGGADGLAFVIQADARLNTALGNHASALGYGAFVGVPTGTAIANSLAIELDTFQGNFGGFADLNGNEISVHTGGPGDNSQSEGFSIGRVASPVNLSDGLVHTLRVRYFEGLLEIWIDAGAAPILSIAYDFAIGGTQILPATPVAGLSLLNGTDAVVGFTASTGGSWETHEILDWTWTSFEGCLAGSVPAIGGGLQDTLAVNLSEGGLGRTVVAGVNTPITIEMIRPLASPLATSNLVLMANFALPAPATGLPFSAGTLCFLPPLPGLPSNALVLFDTLILGLGTLVPGSPPAPLSLTFPAGLPSPVTLTLQGVIEVTPFTFEVTNGVILRVV